MALYVGADVLCLQVVMPSALRMINGPHGMWPCGVRKQESSSNIIQTCVIHCRISALLAGTQVLWAKQIMPMHSRWWHSRWNVSPWNKDCVGDTHIFMVWSYSLTVNAAFHILEPKLLFLNLGRNFVFYKKKRKNLNSCNLFCQFIKQRSYIF